MVKMQVGGLEVALFNLKHSKVGIRDAMGPAIEAGGRAYRSQVRRRIRLRDHTLADLARKDHPYARRHGSIQIHRRKPWQVHSQSGRMRKALLGRVIRLSGFNGYEVTFNYGSVPYIKHVIMGTKVMLPRDVLWQTAIDPVTHKHMMKGIVKMLGKTMKTQLGVRFKSTTPVSFTGAGGSASVVR